MLQCGFFAICLSLLSSCVRIDIIDAIITIDTIDAIKAVDAAKADARVGSSLLCGVSAFDYWIKLSRSV